MPYVWQDLLDAAAESFTNPGREEVRVWGCRESLGPGEVVRGVGVVRLYGRSVGQAALAVLLRARRPMPIGEIVWTFAVSGVEVQGQPNKMVADALRREVARGRAVRVERGVYRVRRLPKTTEWRIIRRWTLRCWKQASWHPDRPLPRPGRYHGPGESLEEIAERALQRNRDAFEAYKKEQEGQGAAGGDPA